MAKFETEKKPDKPQHENRCSLPQDCANLCVGGVMSQCSVGNDWQMQKKCKYYRKSTAKNRCMHYIEALNGHCDCVDAQRKIRREHGRNYCALHFK